MHSRHTVMSVVWPLVFVCALTSDVAPRAVDEASASILFDFQKGFDPSMVEAQDAKVSLHECGSDTALRVETGTKNSWPGVILKAPKGSWDLSRRAHVSLDISNVGKEQGVVYCRVDNPGADGVRRCKTGSSTLKPGQRNEIKIILPRKLVADKEVKFIGMRGDPPVSTDFDTSNIAQLIIFVSKPRKEHTFHIHKIYAGGREKGPIEREGFFPMIDEFGQYIHKDWPGKTYSLSQMTARKKAEEKDLPANPGPPNRNQYGGWTAGPQLKATGFFRVERYQGKWWLVDPEGRLFWSHGIDCVRSRNATPITDREHYYRNLPEPESPFAKSYSAASWAPHGYYKKHAKYRTYDFSQANLLRKYGQNSEKSFAELAHLRLRNWGMNTIANWSDERIYLMRKTPYVCTVNYRARKIEGSEGYWGKFNDVFDPSFREGLQKRLAREKGRAANDPWCIGFFVDNELAWGDEVSLAVATLVSPPEQAAKRVFLADLKSKYRTISDLNAVWGTNHASWDTLLQCKRAPDRKKAWADLTAFYSKIAETYFRTVREAVKEVAPRQLYLGCRFAWVNDRAARAAARFCDVVGYNRYAYSVEEQRLPGNINKPIIIGEFHFGALDRGMFHTGLRKARDQEHRGQLYEEYVRGALRNRYIVGTHWFQYKDQATTGRGDGENYQIGFVDICDTPYQETVQACRRVGYVLYEYRLRSK
ncbi:beta-galactosidase [bacterium]|nr:beta-galactosidase [bacterium]